MKMPQISFESDMHDFGQLMAGENISYSFKFTNTGNADLVISGCDASCGCTVADFPHERIAPGKSNYITVSFKSQGMSGQQVNSVMAILIRMMSMSATRSMSQFWRCFLMSGSLSSMWMKVSTASWRAKS